jgi:O-antigen/teichoic acid export membrane protein
MGWLFFDKVLRMGVGLLVGVWVARYLGPEQFGLLSFALAFVGMFGAVAGLGLQSIVVRDIVADPLCKEETLGTAAVLQLVGGFIAYFLVLGTIFWLRADDTLAKVLVAILGSSMLFKASEVVVYWFESQVLSKYTVWIQNSVFLIFAVVKVLLILNHAPLVVFAWATLAEGLVFALALLILTMHGQLGLKMRQLRFSVQRVRSLILDSWPLMISGIAIMIFMRIDQIMLGEMVGDQEVGIYSAAVRISEVWYFAIGIVLASIFPGLAKLHANNSLELSNKWIMTYRLMFYLSTSIAIFFTFFSTPLTVMMFGEEYLKSGDIIAIYAWAGINVAIGSVWSKWLLLENKMTFNLYGHVVGAIANIILNVALIPSMGAHGAAIATLISLTIASVFEKILYKPSVTYKYIIRAIFFH